MKRIKWISAGGTISCVSTENGLAPRADKAAAERMLSELPDTGADITAECPINIDSTDLCPDDLRILGECVNRAVSEGFNGIVITHGTDTMAYTSAILSKMFTAPPVPIIITGSQRPFFEKNSDGKANLYNSIKAAIDSRFKGVFLLFGDKVIEGCKAHKDYTMSDNAFVSAEGYAGSVKNGEIICELPEKNAGEYRYTPLPENEVTLIKLTPFTPADTIENAVKNGAKRIVIEGYGLGGIPSRMLSSVKSAASSGVKITVISQCLYEGTDMNVYEVGRNALGCGVMQGGKMCAEAAVAEMIFME